MAKEILGFEWLVSRKGYKVVELVKCAEAGDGDGSELRCLWDGQTHWIYDQDRDYIVYNPLTEYKAMFRAFAQLDGSEESIVQFATKYGRLGGPIQSFRSGGTVDGGYAPVHLEPIIRWRKEIDWVKHILDVFTCFEEKDIEGMHSHEETMCMHLDEGEMASLETVLDSPELIKSMNAFKADRGRKDPFWYVKLYLWTATNKRLSKLSTPGIIWDPNAGKFILQILPSCLLGAIWLQIALAMSGDRRHVECEACGEWFEIHPDVARSDKRYCSNACRNRIYRKNKKRATDLFNQGSSIENISQELKSETARINKWIAEANNSARD